MKTDGRLSIAMQSSQEIIDAEIGDEDSEEGNDHVEMVIMGLPEESYRRLVQRYGIHHEGDERP